MASSEHRIELASEGDLAALDALVEAAGGNQTTADWRLFLDHGQVWCIRDAAGRAVASAALLPYPPATAWISMVLTLPEARGKGHGTRLFAEAVAAAEAAGLSPQLDATPLGRPIYQVAGFRSLVGLHRWRRHGQSGGDTASGEAEPMAAAAWDQRALGFARPWLIEALLARGPAVVTEMGIALSRQGRKAIQVGPIIAHNDPAALMLLDAMLDKLGSGTEVVIDAVDGRPAFTAALGQAGFTPERPFTRMAKGAVPRGDDALLYAIAGPELG
jgi:GNAT superfamily N-acetyltransferase